MLKVGKVTISWKKIKQAYTLWQ